MKASEVASLLRAPSPKLSSRRRTLRLASAPLGPLRPPEALAETRKVIDGWEAALRAQALESGNGTQAADGEVQEARRQAARAEQLLAATHRQLADADCEREAGTRQMAEANAARAAVEQERDRASALVSVRPLLRPSASRPHVRRV